MEDLWQYEQVGELTVRQVVIETGKGGAPVNVVHITDPHYKGCTEEDLKNPVLRSTNEYRWAFDPKVTVPNTRRALDYADEIGADQIVVTGDAVDYLSEGSLTLFRQEIWDRYREPDGSVRRVMAALGNHEPLRQMQGIVPDPTAFESRYPILQAAWEHPIFYSSKVLGDKVMLIQMDNGSRCDQPDPGFSPEVEAPFAADLALARERGYTVLLFYHVPIATGDPADTALCATQVGDPSGKVVNFSNFGVNDSSTGVSGRIRRMITHNADLIRGCFCGHNHNDFAMNIRAELPDGTPASIPQYVLIGTPYQKGHLARIVVK